MRCKTLAKLESQNKELCEYCIDSFTIFQRYREAQRLLNNDLKIKLKFQTLSKSKKCSYKDILKPIKDIQELVNTQCQLSQIM
ncbi:MAG: cell fate (sporulation/competence/biofilm development) regulator YlbF (YheA/YmcA/DUF963 family) [Sediminicola sp.]